MVFFGKNWTPKPSLNYGCEKVWFIYNSTKGKQGKQEADCECGAWKTEGCIPQEKLTLKSMYTFIYRSQFREDRHFFALKIKLQYFITKWLNLMLLKGRLGDLYWTGATFYSAFASETY